MLNQITIRTSVAHQSVQSAPMTRVDMELTSDLLNEKDDLLDTLLAFGLDTLGAGVVALRVIDPRTLLCASSSIAEIRSL